MPGKRVLSSPIRSYGQTVDLKSGAVTVPGFDLDFIEVKPQIAAYRRMVRDLEFDICEMASTTYFIARAYGKGFKALPVFFNRRFHHHDLIVRPDAGIEQPLDLVGRKIGVRAYSVTTGVWTRGVLQNEFGLDPYQVTWVVDDEEHVQELSLPDNVQHVPEGESIASLMARGEVVASFHGNAGIGRVGAPTESWNSRALPAADSYRPLIADADRLEAEWYGRTGILPCHGVIVIKDEVAAAHPELPKLLYDAFVESKHRYLGRLRDGSSNEEGDGKLLRMMKIVGDDPIPYGVEANIRTIEALKSYATQQGLMPRDISRDDLFYNFN